MLAQESPFRPYWWGISLAEAGVSTRPDIGTYGQYSFEDLPPVPFPMTGDLSWLATQPIPEEWSIGSRPVAELPALLSACERLGVALPPAFLTFLSTPGLQQRIRSCTGCFVDVSAAPVPAPGGAGHLIRFLADQQGCLYWHVYVTADGRDHAVVCSPGPDGPSDEEDEEDEADGADGDGDGEITFCGESFETFLCRYWLENEIWWAGTDGTPMPAVGTEYLNRYRDFGTATGG